MVVVSLVRTLTDSFGSASDLYRKLKRKAGAKDSDDEDDVPTTIRQIFAIAEPNGLTQPEMESAHMRNDQANHSS